MSGKLLVNFSDVYRIENYIVAKDEDNLEYK